MDNTPAVPTTATSAAIGELANDEAVVLAAIAAYKKDGLKGLIPLLPQIADEARKDVAAVEAAIPEIKTGYKSTEFLATVGAISIGAIYFGVTGHDVPVNLGACATAVLGLYTVARTLLKAKTVTAAA